MTRILTYLKNTIHRKKHSHIKKKNTYSCTLTEILNEANFNKQWSSDEISIQKHNDTEWWTITRKITHKKWNTKKNNNHKKFNIMIHNYTRRYTTLYHEIKCNTAKYNDENWQIIQNNKKYDVRSWKDIKVSYIEYLERLLY